VANGGPINHVGALFARLEVLFGDGPDGMADADFRTDTAGVEAKWDDWGSTPAGRTSPPRARG